MNSELEDAGESQLESIHDVPEDWILYEDAQAVLSDLQDYFDNNGLTEDNGYTAFFSNFVEDVNFFETTGSDNDADIEPYNHGDADPHDLEDAHLDNHGDAHPDNFGDSDTDNLADDRLLKIPESKGTGKEMHTIVTEHEPGNQKSSGIIQLFDKNSQNLNEDPVVASSTVIVRNGLEPIEGNLSPSELNAWIKEMEDRTRACMWFQSHALDEKKQCIEIITLDTSDDSADSDVEVESEWRRVIIEDSERTNKRKRKWEPVLNSSDDITQSSDVISVKKVVKPMNRDFESFPAKPNEQKKLKPTINRREVNNHLRFKAAITPCTHHCRLHDILTNPEEFLLSNRPRIVSTAEEVECIQLD